MSTDTPIVSPDPIIPSLAWDNRGLLVGTTYHYRADGGIDWRKMIPHEFLAIKREYEDELKVVFKTDDLARIDRSQIPDHKLLILLGGMKRLLWLRGYTSLSNPCTFVTPEKAVATCTITFAPNYETRGLPVTYSWTASASYSNTSGDIPQMFLEATACNRAFCLCLRGFLNIGVVAKDEMGPARMVRDKVVSSPPGGAREGAGISEEVAPPQGGFMGKDTLAKRCYELGIPFEKVKETALAKYKGELKGDPAAWVSFDDVTSLDAYTLLDKLSKVTPGAPEAKGKAKKG
jgi:hypothetical protein